MTQEPRVRVAPRAASTFGDLAADFASDYELSPDPWQRLVLDDWLAEKAGKWASLTCGLSVPRQNGKNAVLEMRELFGMVGRGERILHTAHQVKTAQKHFRRLKHFFGSRRSDPAAKFPELNALVADVRNVNGQEAIYLHNGGSVEIVARSQGSGRGYTVDVLVMDEAQDMSDEDLEALMSTTSAAPSKNPQWIFTGTPPGPKAAGEVFTRVRAEALSGKARRQCWHEWSAEPGVDLDDHEVWRDVNPALLTGRLQLDVCEGERSNLSDDGFARERLGMWSSASSLRVISDEAWRMATDAASIAVSRFALAVDVAPDLMSASVAVAGQRADGDWHVDVGAQRSGADWVPGWVARFLAANPSVRAVVVDAGSPAAAIVDDLTRLKVKITVPGVRDVGAACARFADGVKTGTVWHVGDARLSLAVDAGRKRALGKTELWAWNRKNPDADITPLVACTLALWGAQNTNVKKPAGRGSGKVAVL